ncbi:M14 family zinc carboxypeptidase [Schinkia azotoformans]|uniref:M14 family zinc carboxypeptidase n=1 Tax=Schinkia azotoformans TaxID=1454 RepID=UPI002DBF16AC|nr:M14 family zinc carboxypeptidase [Schinkia azotoformans]MEC1721787.1 M14 family zinc carboxypeptidase [Schinkia azotoformans]MED4352406.1 M14 family zinc carboxypeptidase [Schinkia azotoformans]MED4414949.1 M14 family zinc carboxypeptidase [Schinkia azotoformans]
MKGNLIVFFFCLYFCPLIIHAEIVETDEVYTYESLTEDLLELSKLHPNLITYKSLTTTPYGREIWAVKIGHGKPTVLIHGAHHAREWMTSTLLMKMIETYADSYKKDKKVGGYESNILEEVSIWFVPMVNPDGVTLQQMGLFAFPSSIHPSLVKMNKGSLNFIRWKANLNGIDLNRQYPANWENLKGVSNKPSYQFYKGTSPLEAIEVKALVDFTYEIKPEIAVSYHSSGNMLFWGFYEWGLTHTTNFAIDYFKIAEKVADMTRYKLEVPKSFQQGGGYTDWFIEEFEKTAFTVEIGSLIEDSSLPLDSFPLIWERNKAIGLFLAKRAIEKFTYDRNNIMLTNGNAKSQTYNLSDTIL